MSDSTKRRPRPAVASHPIPTLELAAAALGLTAATTGTGCGRNPFDHTRPPPEPSVRPETQPALRIASAFASQALMTTAPDHHETFPGVVAVAHATAVAASPASEAAGNVTPGGCSMKENLRYYGGGGAYVSITPYRGARYRRYR